MRLYSSFFADKVKTLIKVFHTTPDLVDELSLRIDIDMVIEAMGEFEDTDERQYTI